MKHNAIIILILTFVSLDLSAQKADTLNVYYQALKLHLDYWDTHNSKKTDLADIPTVYYIEKNDYTTNSLPLVINGEKIMILESQELYDKTKKEEIPLIAIRPARWDEDKLIIHVIDYIASRKRKHYYYANRGGSSFQIIGIDNGNLGLKLIHQGWH